MTKPNFICVGSQKAGTDWVYDQFGAHEDYWQHPIKEIAFFDTNFGRRRLEKAERQLGWRLVKHGRGGVDYTHEISFLLRMQHGRGKPWNGDFKAYYGLFENKPGRCFDCTPGYARLERDRIRMMLDDMPDTKFLVCVRDPSSRLWSQAQMHVRLNRGPHKPTRSLEDFIDFAQHKGAVELSFASKIIERWTAEDKDGRFRVFNFDELKIDANAYRTSIANFVGADPDKFGLAADFNKKAKQPGKSKMPEEYRAWCAEYFKDEYSKLEQQIGAGATAWREKNDAILSS